MNVRPQVVATLMPLLSLVPVALYVTGHELISAVALVNVLIIAASLYVMFSASDGEQHGSAAH
jgi:FtsH-binding integral membrane protein